MGQDVHGAMLFAAPTRRLCGLPLLMSLALCLGQAACAGHGPPLASVGQLDLPRYMGTWYEVAAVAHPSQAGCTGSQARYALQPDGTVAVHNLCHKDTLDGPVSQVHGVAWVPNAARSAELKVRIFWPFRGDYWVLAVGPEYRWAVVGQPKRKYLWILSRTPQLDAQTLAGLLRRVPEWGYDPAAVRRTLQPPEATSAAGTNAVAR